MTVSIQTTREEGEVKGAVVAFWSKYASYIVILTSIFLRNAHVVGRCKLAH